MRLYLVQHGHAMAKDENPDRPLNDAGIGEVTAVAAFLQQGPSLEVRHVYHSGKPRARQTAEILTQRLASRAKVEAARGLGPKDDPDAWIERLRGASDDVILVGHLPHLSRLAARLLADSDDNEVVRFQKGGVVCLGRDEAGTWSLHWAVVPGLVGVPEA